MSVDGIQRSFTRFSQIVPVVSTDELTKDILCQTFLFPEIAASALPGQFVEISVPGSLFPMIPRPFSVHQVSVERGEISVLYEAHGQATRQFALMTPGETLRITGPLGRRYPVEGNEELIIVAGGLGVASFLHTLQWMRAAGIKRSVKLFYGARSVSHLVRLEEFRRLGVETVVATDDGSQGHHGFITQPLQDYLEAEACGQTVFICGPTPMMKACQQLCSDYDVRAWLSLETYMGCGMGTCVGCTVRWKGDDGDVQYLRACIDGPLFESERLVW